MKHLLIVGLSTLFSLSLILASLFTPPAQKIAKNRLFAQDENPTIIIIELHDHTVYEVESI